MTQSLNHSRIMTQEQESVKVTVTTDAFGEFLYAFSFKGEAFICFGFPSKSDAFSGAEFHLHCLWNSLPHEVADGLGAIYRPIA